MARRRWVCGTLLANIGPKAVLGGVWSLLPVTQGARGLFGGGFAGLSAVAFARLLHAVLASDERWHTFYTEEHWHFVLKRWDDLALNLNKRGVTLDVSTAAGRRVLGELVTEVDAVGESFLPGHPDKWGIGFEGSLRGNRLIGCPIAEARTPAGV